MRFSPPLQPAVLIRRYKRFLADVEIDDGRILTVHCPNSGSMRGCDPPVAPVMLSRSDNPRRKYAHTLEMVRINGCWVGINTARTNDIVEEGLLRGIIDELSPFDTLRREVTVSGRSRLDFLLQSGDRSTYLEVKNCTLAENGTALFPDAVTSRGTRHLHELAALRAAGNRAAVLFCVQRRDTDHFQPAVGIDPLYAETLAAVRRQGVLVLACQALVSPEEIRLQRPLPVVLP